MNVQDRIRKSLILLNMSERKETADRLGLKEISTFERKEKNYYKNKASTNVLTTKAAATN